MNSDLIVTRKYLKFEWLKPVGTNSKVQDVALANRLPGQIVVNSFGQRHGRMWTSMYPEQLLELLYKNYNLYEVISDYPHKMYFDIDLSDTEVPYMFLDTIQSIITQFFPDAIMAISGSSVPQKTSYHIILQNYIIRNEEDRILVKRILVYMKQINSAFDTTVYTKNRNMKCINQSKQDGRIQSLITMEDLKSHCITCFIPNLEYLPIVSIIPEPFREAIDIAKSKEPFDIMSLPKLTLKYTLDKDYTDLTAEDILRLLPITGDCDHSYTHLVARFCYYNGINRDVFISWIQHKHTDRASDLLEIQQKWCNHWSRLDRFPEVSTSKMKPILSYFYPSIKKDRSFKRFEETFSLDEYPHRTIDRLAQCDFFNDEKYSIYNIGMGGGKTAQTIDYLESSPEFVWIAPNRALAHNTFNRLQDKHLDVTYYSTVTTKDKNGGALNRCDNLLIVANSLHYVTTRVFKSVIIDEIETLLDKWFGSFMKHKAQNWTTFKRMILSATKVILLDAFVTSKTLKFIRMLDPSGSICIYARTLEKLTRIVQYVPNYKSTVASIISDLNAGMKLFIFYPFKNSPKRRTLLKVDEDNVPTDISYEDNDTVILSMEDFFQFITDQTGKPGIYYNADIDEPIKLGLRDVNVSWEDKSFIITNTVITCGVNYDRTDFDKEYIFIAPFNIPRDVIQVSYRPRHLKTGIINVVYVGKMIQHNSWEIDTVQMNCPVYTSLIDSVLLEKQSPTKLTFQLFCDKAHYAQLKKPLTDTILVEETFELLKEHTATYHNVPDVDWSFEEPLRDKVFKCTATMLEKLMLQKYFFKRKFTPACHNDIILEDLWNNRLYTFVNQVRQHYTEGPSSIFEQIRIDNYLDSIFSLDEEDIKKVKISSELRVKIFNEFKFKNLTKTSSNISILKEIYNTRFGCTIIKPDYHGTKHIDYILPNIGAFDCDTYMRFIRKNSVSLPIDEDD